ncbi:MAG: UDP-N-acetylmuramoyl-tripeptide--D-alanyl-D-alanine ligase [Chloroflexota bacterium]|nr:UDP-N-acetylmuramoyl-tripeptide--D-alanyl-D-alanine ligase [Chloroflexota bacterium]
MRIADLLTALTDQKIDTEWAQKPLGSVAIDSREVEPAGCFVALQGEEQDGHEFLVEALSRGAQALIAERDRITPEIARTLRDEGCWLVDVRDPPLSLTPPAPDQPLCLLAEDSLAALQKWAAYWRRQHQVRVVGVTGSVGKTTTKEMIHSVLSRHFRTLRSEGNYNNEIGLPLTILRLTPTHERIVLEMGMYALGEIAQLARIAQPMIGVITNVGPIHLERLGTLERIAQAKRELVEELPPDGVAILNGDDERVMAMADCTPARVLCYGLGPECDVWADGIVSEGLEGVRFRLHHGDEVLHVRTPLLGRHSVHAALAAATVGLVEDESWEEIVTGLQEISVHLRLVALPGLHGSTLLDDTYNASPASTIAALNLLEELAGRRIAVLGDMLELGDFEEEGHRKVGRRALEVVDLLITVGQLGRIIGQEALACGMDEAQVVMVEDNPTAIAHLRKLIREDDVILVKGSRGVAMEEIVNGLVQGPR